MTAETWLLIAIIGFSLSGVALVVSVFMFIKLNIPSVIGDLNGKTVAREIQAMREANANAPQQGGLLPMYSRARTGRTSRLQTGSLRGTTGSLRKNPASPRGATGSLRGTTGSLRKNPAPKPEAAPATSVLTSTEAGATDVLTPNATPATSVLGDNGANTTPATSVLSDSTTNPIPTATQAFDTAAAAGDKAVPFHVTRSLVFVHTTETI